MCGIVGYVGGREATPFLLAALHRLEYRGYDSAGLAVVGENGLAVVKRSGKIAVLEEATRAVPPVGGCGVAHTRWATHGAPTEANAHPHISVTSDLALVHNGIIENAATLRARLEELGYPFSSETDTESLVHLVDHLWHEGAPLEAAVVAALRHVEGAYGIAVVSGRDPGKVVVAKRGSQLLVAGSPDGTEAAVASDASAVLDITRDVTYLDDGDYAVVRADGYRTYRLDGVEVTRTVHRVTWDGGAIDKSGHDHFMLKEIVEQPASIANVMRGRLLADVGDARLGGIGEHDDELRRVRRIVLTGCGTSWHAALVGAYLLEEMVRLPVSVEYASEFRYRNPVLDKDTLVVAISQSGETADTIAALAESRRRGAVSMGIVNAVGSTIGRESDFGIYLHAGPEVGVASTKAFTSQLVAITLFALRLGRCRHLSVVKGREMIAGLEALPQQVEEALALDNQVLSIAQEFCDSGNFLYLGRGPHFPVALEGALKLKEVSYIHAEGYPAAEMKHGPIALIDRDMPVVVLAPRDSVYHKVVSNAEEVRARDGRVIAVVSDDAPELAGRMDHLLRVPHTIPTLQPVLTVIPLQLLAYHVAVLRGIDVDRPRNLAKSVTVE